MDHLLIETNRSNARKPQDKVLGDMRQDTRQVLTEFYRTYNEELATVLKDQKYLWMD